jgi:hypothetical protein
MRLALVIPVAVVVVLPWFPSRGAPRSATRAELPATCALVATTSDAVRTPDRQPFLVGSARLIRNGAVLTVVASHITSQPSGRPQSDSTLIGARLSPQATATPVVAPFAVTGPVEVVGDGGGGFFVLTYRALHGTSVDGETAQAVSVTLWHGVGRRWEPVVSALRVADVVTDPAFTSRLLIADSILQMAWPFQAQSSDRGAALTGVLRLVVMDLTRFRGRPTRPSFGAEVAHGIEQEGRPA